jgi:hypothetical protein
MLGGVGSGVGEWTVVSRGGDGRVRKGWFGVRSSLMAKGRSNGGRDWGRGTYGPYGLRVEVNYGWRGLAKSLRWDHG